MIIKYHRLYQKISLPSLKYFYLLFERRHDIVKFCIGVRIPTVGVHVIFTELEITLPVRSRAPRES